MEEMKNECNHENLIIINRSNIVREIEGYFQQLVQYRCINCGETGEYFSYTCALPQDEIRRRLKHGSLIEIKWEPVNVE